jgi:hypothetical protein
MPDPHRSGNPKAARPAAGTPGMNPRSIITYNTNSNTPRQLLQAAVAAACMPGSLCIDAGEDHTQDSDTAAASGCRNTPARVGNAYVKEACNEAAAAAAAALSGVSRTVLHMITGRHNTATQYISTLLICGSQHARATCAVHNIQVCGWPTSNSPSVYMRRHTPAVL